MARYSATGATFARLAAIGVALAFAPAPTAVARVGVTSAATGDPLGRPPNEAERVLRIGIDVQANEVVTTQTNDRAHLLFLDGTSLTVGPNSRVTIDKYVFDPDAKTGELALTATTGVFRLVGGKISKKNAITIHTPSSTIGVRGGICIFSITRASTTTTFIFGKDMTVTSLGQTQTATRPGSQITTNTGSAPSQPTMVGPGSLTGTVTSLEGGPAGGSGGTSGGTGGPPASNTAAVDANIGTVSSVNSNQGPGTAPGSTPPGGPSNPSSNPQTNNNLSNATSNAVSNSQTQQQPQDTTTHTTTQTSTQTPTPQTTQTINGYTGGIVGTSAPDAPTTVRLLNMPGQPPAPSDLSISTDASSSSAQATVIVRQYQPVGGRGLPPAVFQMGSISNPGSGTSAFTDDANIWMTDSTDPARKSQISGGTPATVMASAAAAKLVLPGGVTPCECAFLSWGPWVGSVSFPNTPGAIRQGQVDNILAAYVAGTLTNAVQLPNTGTATYSGHAFGFVVDGHSARAAAGGFSQTWNFASQTGNVTISNFDGATYTGNTALQRGTVSFTGPLAGAGRIGQINGSFFSAGPSNPVAGQAGNFSVTGTNYKAGGIFAGQK